jgi:phosphohistidine swiveling domain-containing protein
MENENEILWTSGFINERLPAPISPLGWSHIGPFIEELALRDPLRCLGYPDAETIPLTRLWRGHPYANALAFQIFYKVFPDFILPEDAYRYFPDGDVSLRRRAPYPRWIDAPRLIVSLLRAFFADPFNVAPLTNYRHWARYTREHNTRIAALCARVDAMTHAEPREIFAALRDAEELHRGVLRIHRWSLMDADLTFGLLKRLVAAWIDRAHANDIAARLVADVPNKTLEVDTALRELAISSQQSAIKNFLSEHGHRSFSLDIAVPTFAEEPTQIAKLLQMPTADDRRPTAANPLPSAVSGLQSVVFNAVLSLARHYLALREDQRYYWQKSLALARRLYLMLADRLVADGVIEKRDAVFYATHAELAAYFGTGLPKTEFAQTIAARQAEWREYQRAFEQSPTASYPAFLRGDAPLDRVGANQVSAHPSREWRGRAISPGIARGVARVILSANELARVQRGDILIAPATDPAWTPVFAQIAGLVVERGGVLSHSAVIAREYHVPAVAGITNIVAEIREGELIEVDASRGIVSRVGA